MNSHYRSLLRKLILPIFCLFFLSSSGWAIGAEKLNVEVTGVTGDVLKNVEIWLSIRNAAVEQEVGLLESFNIGEKDKKPELSEPTLQRLHRLAPEEIRQAMQPFGYYEPKIDARIAKVMDVWQAAYTVDPGPPTLLDRVEIRVNGEGGDEPTVKEVLASTEVISGLSLDHRSYEQTKSQLSDALYNAGYIDAKFIRSEIKVSLPKHKADIYLIVESGPPFKFGPITVEQDILDQDFVNRFANMKQGDRFDTSRLINLQLALTDSNYFNQVDSRRAGERCWHRNSGNG